MFCKNHYFELLKGFYNWSSNPSDINKIGEHMHAYFFASIQNYEFILALFYKLDE